MIHYYSPVAQLVIMFTSMLLIYVQIILIGFTCIGLFPLPSLYLTHYCIAFFVSFHFRKPNIFDNMLSIMEKYAYNLEGLVQERTTQLYEEKKKTDMLLNQMLPR